MNILICVLYSDTPENYEIYCTTRWYYKQFPNIKILYYTFQKEMDTLYRMDETTDILYIKGTECIVPGMLQKTVSMFQYLFDHAFAFDYIIKTNIHTIVNVHPLREFLTHTPIEYGTDEALFVVPQHRNVEEGLDNDRYEGILYGKSILLKYDFLRNMMTKKDRFDYSVIEHIAVGHYIGKYFPRTYFVCFSNHSTTVHSSALCDLDYVQTLFFRTTTIENNIPIISIRHIVRMLSTKINQTDARILNLRLWYLPRALPATVPLHNEHTSIYVCVSRYNKNTDWVGRFRNVSRVLVYDKENPNNPYNVPVNKGNEASVYLKYIIDHYHFLPDFTYFVHDEEFAWHHTGSLVDKLQEAIESNEYYYNINDQCVLGSIYDIKLYSFVLEWYKHLVEKYIPLNSLPNPDWTRGHRGSAQFLVHKSRILCLPLDFYREMYEWMITTEVHSYITGRCLEWTWHVFWEKYPYMI